MSMRVRWQSVLKWTALSIGALVLVLAVTLAFLDWNVLKHPIERFASAKSGRQVTIAGDLDVHIWSWTPRATINGLRIGNPSWDTSHPMLDMQRLNVQLKLLPLLKGDVILPRVELISPAIYLHREVSGRATWTFESTRPTDAPAGPPPKLPVVRDFLVQNGTLIVRDELLHLKLDGTVQAHEQDRHGQESRQGAQSQAQAFKIEGKGTLNEKPFGLQVAGGPLVNLDPDHPYPFDLRIEAGDIRIQSDGKVRKPFDLAQLDLNVRASGSDLADLYYLTQLALPNTPPYELSASISRTGQKISVNPLAGKIGESDLHGSLAVDLTRKRPSISGDLISKQLRLKDLAASLGSKPKQGGSVTAATEKPKPSKAGKEAPPPAESIRLFPDSRLQVARVRAMDANVRFRADSIEAGSLPLKKVAFTIQLDNGLLNLAPFEFELPQGRLSGVARIDARGAIPHTHLDVRVKDIQLDQLKGKAPDATPPLGGVVQARAVIDGRGDSIHDFVADADGRLTAVLPQGEVRAAFAELTGINVARGVGLLLKGDEDRAQVRCGVAQFGVERGVMHAQNVVFDTENVRITGRGEVRLGPEELDLSIKGEPKKLRLARLRTPIEINGHLRKPSVGIDTAKTIKQGAVAAALGAVVAPLAAVIAFVDPGLAKDENCAALLASVSTKTADSKPPEETTRMR